MGTNGQWNGKFKRGLALLLSAAMILSTDLSSFAANISANSTTEEETSNQNTLVDILKEEVSQDEASQNEVSQDQPSKDTTEDEFQESKKVSENQTKEVDAEDNELEESQVGSGTMNLEVSCVTYNKAKLTWNAVNGADGYIISRKVSSLNGSSNYENVKTLNKNAKSFVDSRLLNGETYYYKVEAATKSGREYTPFDVSAEVSVDIKIAAPLESKSTAIIDKKNRIIIKWPSVGGAQQYKLSRLVNDDSDPWKSIIDPVKYNEKVNPYRKNSYIDNVDSTTGDSYVYQLVASRRNERGDWIDSEETIIVCTPSVLMANNDGDKDTMGVAYTSIMGCREYEVQRSFNSTKVASFEEAGVVSNTNGKVTSGYNGDRIVTSSLNGIAVEKYLDDGGKEYKPLSHFFGENFFYRVRAVAEVPDGEEGTRVVYSPYSKALKSTVTMEAPILVSVNCVSYNKVNATIKVSNNIEVKDSDYLVFYRSNKLNTGYKEVKRVKARDKSVVYNDANNTISYAFTGFTPENTYYLKAAVIKREIKNSTGKTVSVQTEKSNFLLAKTVFEDVKKVTVKSANYNAMSVSFNKIPGATKYNVYYTTSIGSVSDNSTWVWAKPVVITNKGDKKGVVTYTKSGYKHGQYVAMYAVPISGKFEHQQTKPQLTPDHTRIKAPTLNPKSAGPWKIRVYFTKLTGAQFYYLEYSEKQSNGTPLLKQKLQLTASQLKTSGKNYYYDFGTDKDDGIIVTGKKYYFRVSAYCTKDGVTAEGDVTDYKICQARPNEPTKLKAVYSGDDEGASLSWEKGKGANGYKILRSYNGSKKYVEICPYTPNTYYIDNSKDLSDPKDGKLYKYKVYSVALNKDFDEYTIASEKCAEAKFCNPSSIDVSDVTVGKGSTVTVNVKFSPSETTAKDVKWEITGNGKDYVNLEKSSGDSATFKGIKKGKATIKVTSKNDKSDTFTITVTELTVCLDPGHGGSDSGAVGGGYTEKERNLKISEYTKKRLEKYGVSVVMTRTGDNYVDLKDRTTIAKNNGCNLFVSQHLNASNNHNVSGTEVYYSVNSTYARAGLASSISSRIASAIGTNNRGINARPGENGDYYSVIRTAAQKGIPGIIVEAAFLDTEYSKLSDSGCETIGNATADAILEYFDYK